VGPVGVNKLQLYFLDTLQVFADLITTFLHIRLKIYNLEDLGERIDKHDRPFRRSFARPWRERIQYVIGLTSSCAVP